jgi:hypothetical protein
MHCSIKHVPYFSIGTWRARLLVNMLCSMLCCCCRAPCASRHAFVLCWVAASCLANLTNTCKPATFCNTLRQLCYCCPRTLPLQACTRAVPGGSCPACPAVQNRAAQHPPASKGCCLVHCWCSWSPAQMRQTLREREWHARWCWSCRYLDQRQIDIQNVHGRHSRQ